MVRRSQTISPCLKSIFPNAAWPFSGPAIAHRRLVNTPRCARIISMGRYTMPYQTSTRRVAMKIGKPLLTQHIRAKMTLNYCNLCTI